MEITGHKDIDEFKVWIAQSNQSCLIEKVQELYFRPSYIQFLQAKGKKKAKFVVDTALIEREKEWITVFEERDTLKLKPNQNNIKKELKVNISMKSCNVV